MHSTVFTYSEYDNHNYKAAMYDLILFSPWGTPCTCTVHTPWGVVCSQLTVHDLEGCFNLGSCEYTENK